MLSDEQKEKLLNLGELCYPPDKIIVILEIDDGPAFMAEFHNPESEIAILYHKGQQLRDFKIDSKLYQLAQAGDLKALDDLEYRRKQMEGKK